MSDHAIVWTLRRGVPDARIPSSRLICLAPEGSVCQTKGPWAENVVTDNPVDVGRCWATWWISDDASRLWFGANNHDATSGPVEVEWDGADWVWWYSDEKKAE